MTKMKCYAKYNLWDQDYKTQLAQGYEDIPAGAEIKYAGEMTNFYGRFAEVYYKGHHYYVKPEDIKFVNNFGEGRDDDK